MCAELQRSPFIIRTLFADSIDMRVSSIKKKLYKHTREDTQGDVHCTDHHREMEPVLGVVQAAE